MIGAYHIVESDLYDIANRVREIDPAYFIAWNFAARRFELHVTGQRGGSFALVLPFEALDERTLVLARKTRAERAAELIREAEEHNRRLEREAVRKAVEQAVGG